MTLLLVRVRRARGDERSPYVIAEVTAAHRGVLFLDELGEFRREAIEALRPALEAREVTVERGGVRRHFPSSFHLVAASNPCPCGRGPDDCVCRPLDRGRFRVRMAQGLGDHLPIRVELGTPKGDASDRWGWQCSAVARLRVERARRRAEARLGAGRTNAQMTPEEVRGVPLTSAAVRMLAARRARRPIPRPAPDQTIRVACTVADLADCEFVGERAMRLAIAVVGGERPDAGA